MCLEYPRTHRWHAGPFFHLSFKKVEKISKDNAIFMHSWVVVRDGKKLLDKIQDGLTRTKWVGPSSSVEVKQIVVKYPFGLTLFIGLSSGSSIKWFVNIFMGSG